jgi:hypothetical protein
MSCEAGKNMKEKCTNMRNGGKRSEKSVLAKILILTFSIRHAHLNCQRRYDNKYFVRWGDWI